MEGFVAAMAIVAVAFVARLAERAARHRRMGQIAAGLDDGDDADTYGTRFDWRGVPLVHGTSFEYVVRPPTDQTRGGTERVDVAFVEGQIAPRSTVPSALRPLFDRLDGYTVHRFDTRVRIGATPMPFGGATMPERAGETVAILVRCHTDAPGEVVRWLLDAEDDAVADDRRWLAGLLVDTLGGDGHVQARARVRCAPLMRDARVTDDDARTALLWGPCIGDEAGDALWRIVGAENVMASTRADALARLADIDPPRARDGASAWLASAHGDGGGAAGPMLDAALDVIEPHAGADVLGPLLRATVNAVGGVSSGASVSRLVRLTRAIVAREAPLAPSARSLFADAMRGPWWTCVGDSHRVDALDILGLAAPDGVIAFMLDELATAPRDEVETWVVALGRHGDLTAVAPLMALADGWSGRGGVRRAAERAIAEIQDRCARGAAGGLAVSADEGTLAVVGGAGAGGLSPPVAEG